MHTGSNPLQVFSVPKYVDDVWHFPETQRKHFNDKTKMDVKDSPTTLALINIGRKNEVF